MVEGKREKCMLIADMKYKSKCDCNCCDGTVLTGSNSPERKIEKWLWHVEENYA